MSTREFIVCHRITCDLFSCETGAFLKIFACGLCNIMEQVEVCNSWEEFEDNTKVFYFL